MARSEDLSLKNAVRVELYKANGNRQSYSALPGAGEANTWGAAGWNSKGVGMTSTETIFASDKALKADPLTANGLAENRIYDITLPYITSAREGVKRLASLIEQYGCREGFGVGFIDEDEMWYLESAAGHHYLACRIPNDKYFVSANQSRFRNYDENDKENHIAPDDLITFAIEHNLYNPQDGDFDFHAAYQRDNTTDTTYNYPRVHTLQKIFSPSITNDITHNDFPVFAEADGKITLSDIRKSFRNHYDNTEHDPYMNSNPSEPYRPISIFRTTQTHILERQPSLPQETGCIIHMAPGMADLSVFLPIYQGITSVPEPYTRAAEHSSEDSAYWTFRKVQSLAMTDYNRYSPFVKQAYYEFEQTTDKQREKATQQYTRLRKSAPEAAQKLIQELSDRILTNALDLAKELTEELFNRISYDTEAHYPFRGA